MLSLTHLRRHARRVVSLFRKERDLRFGTVAEAFPGAERIALLPAESVATPDLEGATLVHDVAGYAAPALPLPAVFATVLRDVLFDPYNNVVLTDDDVVIAESVLNLPQVRLLDRHALSVRRVERLPGLHTALRITHNNYYHTVVDKGARLSHLAHPAVRALGPVGLLAHGEFTAHERDLVAALAPGDARHTPVRHRRLYRVERYLLISRSTPLHAGCVREPFKTRLREAFGVGRTGGPLRRLYVSRGNARMRRVEDEDALVAWLGRRGFERVTLGGRTLAEQVALFADAEAVVGPHGAGFTNLLWATDAAVVEAFASAHLVPSYYFMSRALGHRYAALHGPAAHRDHPVHVDLGALERTLDAFGIV